MAACGAVGRAGWDAVWSGAAVDVFRVRLPAGSGAGRYQALPLTPAKMSSGNSSPQLGRRLQRTRITKGLSQESLAHAAGISTYTYQKFEKGESRPGTPMNPRLRTLIALATALDMQVEELVGGMSE